jgi:hypothetical protein
MAGSYIKEDQGALPLGTPLRAEPLEPINKGCERGAPQVVKPPGAPPFHNPLLSRIEGRGPSQGSRGQRPLALLTDAPP